jgi:hypothetical protein
MKTLTLAAGRILLVCLLVSCGGTGDGSTDAAVPRVASVVVASGASSVEAGKQLALTAYAVDTRGARLSGKTITWSVTPTSVATIDTAGTLTGVQAGSASVQALCDGVSGFLTLTILPAQPAAVDRVVVTPSQGWLVVGGSQTFVARSLDAAGNALSGRSVSWSSAAPSVAAVSGGVVAAVGSGPTGRQWNATSVIVATVDGRSGSANVTVTSRDFPAITALTVEPPVLVQGTASTPVTVTARIIGPDVRLAGLVFSAPTGTLGSSRDCELRLSNGTSDDGTWSCTMSWPVGPTGPFELGWIRASTAANYETIYTGAAARARGLASAVTVLSSTADMTPPSLSEFAISPISVPQSAAKSTVITARAADSGIGIRGITIDLGEPSGSSDYGTIPSCVRSAETPDRRDMSWRCTMTLFTFERLGVYPIRSVALYDDLGNVRVYTNAQLLAAGFPAALEVLP